MSRFYLSDDDTFGEEFHSKHFPRLRKFVHSGYRTVHMGEYLLNFSAHLLVLTVQCAMSGAIGYNEINYPHPQIDRSVEALAAVDENAPF